MVEKNSPAKVEWTVLWILPRPASLFPSWWGWSDIRRRRNDGRSTFWTVDTWPAPDFSTFSSGATATCRPNTGPHQKRKGRAGNEQKCNFKKLKGLDGCKQQLGPIIQPFRWKRNQWMEILGSDQSFNQVAWLGLIKCRAYVKAPGLSTFEHVIATHEILFFQSAMTPYDLRWAGSQFSLSHLTQVEKKHSQMTGIEPRPTSSVSSCSYHKTMA